MDEEPFITNSFLPPTEGFGVHYLEIIAAMTIAELVKKPFFYSPIEAMAHNYENDPYYIIKAERLINVASHIPHNVKERKPTYYTQEFYNYFPRCIKTSAFATVKKLFYLNKNKTDYLTPALMHCALHIRRRNPHDEGGRTNGPLERFCEVIERLRGQLHGTAHRIHILSQGPLKEFQEAFKGEDIVFHIDEPFDLSFCLMAFADLLVIPQDSTFSNVAALLTENPVYYLADQTNYVMPNWKKM